MNKTTSNVMKGLMVGAAVGTAAYMLSNTKQKKTGRMLKKKAGKAMKAVSAIADNVITMMK